MKRPTTPQPDPMADARLDALCALSDLGAGPDQFRVFLGGMAHVLSAARYHPDVMRYVEPEGDDRSRTWVELDALERLYQMTGKP